MQIIFQDPYTALNPYLTALELVSEPLLFKFPKKVARQQAFDMLQKVGIEEIDKFPRDFSGGQRQRIGIARAMISQPELILCDEPTSALDVSIQAQILQLLKQLQKEQNLAYLFISHDLGVIKQISDRIAVLYQGFLVEIGTADEIFNHPQHAYTQKLLQAIPILDPKKAREQFLNTQIPEVPIPTKNAEYQMLSATHRVLVDKK